jgi:uncharacterized membrane protein YfcA
MIFFPPQVAIAATAVVHMANNVFKLFLVGKYAHWPTIRTFGLASLLGALLGALSLQWLARVNGHVEFVLFEHSLQTDFIRIAIAGIILVFAFIEISPAFESITLPKRWMPAGGLISGFFGGISGHQGALRSAFLMRSGLTKDAFMGTRVVCACIVDVSRISVYATSIAAGWKDMRLDLLVIATLAAFGGAWQGNKWVKKTELPVLNKIISVALIVFAIAFALGVI